MHRLLAIRESTGQSEDDAPFETITRKLCATEHHEAGAILIPAPAASL
jgi:hypothetical protein